MSKLIYTLNEDIARGTQHFCDIRMNLTSSTFVSSWDERQCIVTLHYSAPFQCVHKWKEQAEVLIDKCSLMDTDESNVRFIGRSKGVKIVVTGKGEEQTDCDIKVSDEIWVRGERIKYIKPEGAFQHPNPRVMYHALEWILDCVDNIKKQSEDCSERHVRLLEMYSGCGAHTMVMSNKVIGAFDKIVAVELDKRLVDSCIYNCKLNGVEDVVRVVQGDAGEYARKCVAKKTNDESWWHQEYGLLLVDPPRQGLDEHVCALALSGTFQHMLYISCGRSALQRDILRLHNAFEVMSCVLLDLFPRTDAIETLVHLKRRRVKIPPVC